jgi:hypothetical protein
MNAESDVINSLSPFLLSLFKLYHSSNVGIVQSVCFYNIVIITFEYFVFRASWDNSSINTNKMSHYSTFYFLFCYTLHVSDTERVRNM